MSILDRLAEFIGSEPRKQRVMLQQRANPMSQVITPWRANQPVWPDANVATYDADGYRKIGLIFRCIQYLANAAGAAPLRVYLDTPEGQKDEVPDHELRRLLERPNAGQGEATFISFVTMVAAVTGYCVIEKERDRYGNVIGLWALRSDWLRPIPRQGRAPDWEYRVPGYEHPFLLKAEDAIPITYADTPTGAHTGIGPLEVLLRDVGISNALTDFVKAFLDRGALPLYFAVPETEGPLAAQWGDQGTVDAFRAKFRQTYSGLDNATDVMVAPAIKDIKQLGFNLNELAYTDLRDVSEVTICTAFGIPPILVGARAGLERATYSNYEQARRSFYEDVATFWWARLDDTFTRHLMPEFETRPQYSLAFDVSDIPALQDDEQAAHEIARADFAAALISRHVAQRMAGVEPHGPDVFLQPFGVVEIPATATDARPALSATVEPLADDDDARALPEPAFITRDGGTYVNERALTPEQRASADRIAAHNKQQIIRLAGLAEPVLERFFRGQAERLADIAARGMSGAVVSTRENERPEPAFAKRAIEQIDWGAEDRELREALEAWWRNVSEVAFADISAALNTDIVWTISNPLLAELFDVLGYRVRDINATTRQAIETIVRESLIEGTTIPDLADHLRDVITETYRGRAESIARTESQLAYNLSSQKAYQQSGVVSRVRMHDGVDCESKAGSDGLTCPQRNGRVVSVSDMPRHISAEHPRGTLAFSPIVEAV